MSLLNPEGMPHCDKCGISGIHACPGKPLPAPTAEQKNRMADFLERTFSRNGAHQLALVLDKAVECTIMLHAAGFGKTRGIRFEYTDFGFQRMTKQRMDAIDDVAKFCNLKADFAGTHGCVTINVDLDTVVLTATQANAYQEAVIAHEANKLPSVDE